MKERQLVMGLKNVVRERLSTGYPTVEQAAGDMELSLRTLQRRLQRLEMTYSELVEQVRHEDACRLLLEHPSSIGEIAVQLGYSDPSHFSRAFRRWEGINPRAYRSQK